MKLVINKKTGAISYAYPDLVGGLNNKLEQPTPKISDDFELIDFNGDPEIFEWPHPNGPSACILKEGEIIANEEVE